MQTAFQAIIKQNKREDMSTKYIHSSTHQNLFPLQSTNLKVTQTQVNQIVKTKIHFVGEKDTKTEMVIFLFLSN